MGSSWVTVSRYGLIWAVLLTSGGGLRVVGLVVVGLSGVLLIFGGLECSFLVLVSVVS